MKMRRLILPAVLISPLALAACAPPVPDSGAGFGEATSYNMAREGALNTGAPILAPGAQPIVSGGVTSQPIGGSAVPGMGSVVTPGAPAPGTGFDPNALGAAIDRAGGAPAAASPYATPYAAAPTGVVIGAPMATVAGSVTPAPVTPAPVTPAPVAPAPVVPAPLPAAGVVATGPSGPNLVQYALTTSNAVGAPVYQRSSLALRSPEKVCAGYGSPDLAQLAFLEAGGPQKDRKGLDPDGDGFACAWDPSPFRNAVK